MARTCATSPVLPQAARGDVREGPQQAVQISQRPVLPQAARELLLAQSSDWAFILKAGTMAAYARRRTEAHLRRFAHLARQCERAVIDEAWLTRLEALDNLFPELDYRVYA